MDMYLQPNVILSLGILAGVVLVSAVVGLRRGWTSQLVILALVVALWILSNVAEDTLINLANSIYKGILLLFSCGIKEDTSACVETSGVMGRILADPDSPDQRRLFFLVVSMVTLLVAYLIITRFGNRPLALRQRLMGAILGIANGLILIYLLLPSMLEQLPLQLPEAGLPVVGQGSAPFVALVLFVLFVVVAVRFIRPPPTREEA